MIATNRKDEKDLVIPTTHPHINQKERMLIILPTHVLLHLFSFIHEHFHCIISMNFSDTHLLIKNQRPRVLSVEILISARLYRDINFSSIVLNNRFKDMICGFMTKYNDIEGLKWAEKHSRSLEGACLVAAMAGNINILKWLKEMFESRPLGCGNEFNEVCSFAAYAGKLDVIKFARKNGWKWDARTCSEAAKVGHLDIIIWARRNGCPWDEKTCTMAAASGHLRVLQHVRLNSFSKLEEIRERNAAKSHIFQLPMPKEEGCPWSKDTTIAAATGGFLDILQWAILNQCPCDGIQCFAVAAEKGHLHVLQWLHSQNIAWNETTCTSAAKAGHLSILQWARSHYCPWDANVIIQAAKMGHFHVVQWARNNKCPWTSQATLAAATGGHMEILQWLVQQGCQWHSGVLSVRNPFIVSWARANGCQ